MNARLTLRYTQNADIFYTWTENFFATLGTTFPTQPFSGPLAFFLARANGFHGAGCQLASLRIVDTANKHSVQDYALTYPIGTPNGGDGDADNPNSAALLVSKGATTGRIVRQWVRGIRDGLTKSGGKLQTDDDPYTRWKNWAATFSGFIQLRTRVLGAEINITNIDLTSGIVTVQTNAPTPGTIIYMYRLRGVPYLHQSWRVASNPQTNQLTLAGFQSALAVGELSFKNAYLCPLTYGFEAIQSGYPVLVRATAHETARPLCALPGKRKTR